VSKRGKWQRVGYVAVDSGHLWISDPGYVLHTSDRPQALGADWDEFAEKLIAADGAVPFHFNDGRPGLGVAVESGLGDGVYPVEVHRSADGTITMLTITFLSGGE